MYRESSGKAYTYTMCMRILKHSRSCEVKGMAEVRDVAIEGYSSVTSSC